jgi:hypothetical protein
MQRNFSFKKIMKAKTAHLVEKMEKGRQSHPTFGKFRTFGKF